MRKNKPEIPTLPEHVRKICAIYGRVSTDKQALKFSPESQMDAMLAKAASKGLTVPPELRFMDVYSGKQENRPKLDKLRDLVRTQQMGHVIIYTVDRMSRRVEHGALLAAEFKRAGVVLDFVEVPYEDTPSGRLMFHVMMAMAEFMGEMIVENSHRGRQTRAEKGLWNYLYVPFGYVYVSEHSADRDGAIGNMKIHEPDAKIVRQIFEWYRSGVFSLYEIANRLNDQGIPSPRGGKWSANVIRQILDNRAYIGHAKGSAGVKETPCPIIIDRIVFEEVQERRRTSKEERRGRPTKKHLLAGHLRCGRCKHRCNAHKRGALRDTNYECHNIDLKNRGKRICFAPFVPASRIEPAVWNAVWGAISQSLWQLAKDYYERKSSAPKEDLRRSLTQKIGRLEAEQKRAKENMKNPRFDLDEANAAYDDVTGKLQLAQAEFKALAIEMPALPPKQEIELIERTIRENPPETFDEKRMTLKKCGVMVHYADGEAEISGAVCLDRKYWHGGLTHDGNKSISIPFNLKVRVA